MTQTGPNALFRLLALCNFAVGMGAFSLIGLVEPLAQGFSVPVSRVAFLLTVYALAFAICAPLLAALTGRFGRRRVLALGLGICGGATLLAAVVPGFGWLYPLRALAAAGAGMVTPVSLAIAVALAPEGQRGRALSSVFVGISFAMVIGVPVATWAGYALGWRESFAAMGALILLCQLLVLWRVPRGLQVAPVGLPDLGRALRDGVVLWTVGFTVMFLAALYVVFTLLSPLLSQGMGFDGAMISLALFLYGAATPAGNIFGGHVADRLGPALSLSLICLVQIGLLPVFGLFPLPVWLVLALVVAWGFVGAAFSPPQQLRLVGLDPARGTVLMSLHAASIYIGTALGSAVGAVVLERAGLEMLGPVAAAVMFVALGVLLWSHRAAQMRGR